MDEKIPEISYQLRKANDRVESLEEERDYLLDSNTNVPVDISRIRKSLAEELDRDIAELPFIAEVIQVVPDENKWTGPIERLMRSISLTIIVPSKLSEKAEAYLEDNHLGEKISIVCPQSVSKEIKFDEDSVVAKLAFRTELEKSRLKWLRAFLYERFPHLCFEQRGKKYDSIANALTLEGSVSYTHLRAHET